MAAEQNAAFYAYQNASLSEIADPQNTAFYAFMNTSVGEPPKTTVIRQPRGWGILPTGPQTVQYLTQSAPAYFYATENTTA